MVLFRMPAEKQKQTQKKIVTNRGDSITAVILLCFSIAIGLQASRYPFGTINKIGPGFLPFYASILLGLLAIAILLQGILKPMEEYSAPWKGMTRSKAMRVALVFSSALAYTFLLDKLGFPVSTFLFIIVLLRFVESYGWIPSLLAGMGTSIACYFLFAKWLQCQFPIGWLGI